MSLMDLSLDLELFADLIGDPHECAGPRTRQCVLGPYLPALQPVQHLLEPDLYPPQLGAAAGDERREREHPEAERRQRQEREQHPERRRHDRPGGPGSCEDGSAPDPGPAEIAHIRAQPHVTESRLQLRHLTGDFDRPGERVAAAAGPEPPLHGRDKSDLRLPGDPIGIAALHAQQLFVFHPGRQRPLDAGAVTRHDAVRVEAPGPYERPGQAPLAALLGEAGPLLEQRLLQVTGGDADVVAERDELRFGEALSDVALAGLELGRALDDPVEGLPADQLARHGYARTFSLSTGLAGRDSPAARAGRAGMALSARRPATVSRMPLKRSIGTGKIVVEFFSDAISVTVWR